MNLRIARKLAALDPALGRVIERAEPISQLKPQRQPPYQSLVRAVIYQQLSGKAAATILQRFLALFPRPSFPTPHALLQTPAETLRTAGLSRPKLSYLHDIARHALAGHIPSLEDCEALDDAALIESLTQIKGVGRWTVQMMLIFNLGRPDVLPAHDLGVRKGFQVVYGRRSLPSPEAIDRFGRRWAPYRTTATWYLWRAADDA